MSDVFEDAVARLRNLGEQARIRPEVVDALSQPKALLAANPNPTRQDVVEAIAGNICRCTGYEAIINAILDAAKAGAGQAYGRR